MAEFPALPLFTDAYLADTRHLNTIQHGAYLLMLMTAWRSSGCCLLDDDNYLARITGMDKRTWLANKAILMSFWHLNDEQKWQQGRLLDERNYVEQLRNKNAAAGRASALKRLNRGSTTVQPNGNQNPTPTPIPTPLKEIYKENGRKGRKMAGKITLDENSEAFKAWEAYTKATEGKGCPRAVIRPKNGRPYSGWYFPTEWPPELETPLMKRNH